MDIIELGGGSSPVYHPNFDIIKASGVDYVCDVAKGILIPDDSVDLIYSRDFIEHITFLDFLSLLRECRRVLRCKGQIEFVTADVYKAITTHSEFNLHVSNVLIGNWETPEMRHKMWYTPELVRYILEHEKWWNIIISEYKKDSDYWKEPKMLIRAQV